MKSKVEPMLSTLSEICNGLSCYNVLSLIRVNSDIFYAVFCPSKVFTWTYEMFQQLIKPIYSVKIAPTKGTQKCVYINILLTFSWMVRFSFINLSPDKCL